MDVDLFKVAFKPGKSLNPISDEWGNIEIEACASSHHWSRELQALGHAVRLMPPVYVKPYVKSANAIRRMPCVRLATSCR
jgi:hypothetical protein